VVEHLDRGGRVVHRGRQREVRDVDHDPDRERGILLDRPLGPEGDHPAQPAFRPVRRLAVDLDQGRPDRDEVADDVREHEEAPVPAGPADEARAVDRLDRPRAVERTRSAGSPPASNRPRTKSGASGEPAQRTASTKAFRPASPTSAATATGRMRWSTRSR